MERINIVEPSEVLITESNLEQANLTQFSCLELHMLNYAVVVIPGEMTGIEIIRASQSMQEMASEMLMGVIKNCKFCDNCGRDKPCELMTSEILPDIIVPTEELLEAGIDLKSKLTCEADPEKRRLLVYETDEEFDISDIAPGILDLFRDCGVCLRSLDEIIRQNCIVHSKIG